MDSGNKNSNSSFKNFFSKIDEGFKKCKFFLVDKYAAFTYPIRKKSKSFDNKMDKKTGYIIKLVSKYLSILLIVAIPFTLVGLFQRVDTSFNVTNSSIINDTDVNELNTTLNKFDSELEINTSEYSDSTTILDQELIKITSSSTSVTDLDASSGFNYTIQPTVSFKYDTTLLTVGDEGVKDTDDTFNAIFIVYDDNGNYIDSTFGVANISSSDYYIDPLGNPSTFTITSPNSIEIEKDTSIYFDAYIYQSAYDVKGDKNSNVLTSVSDVLLIDTTDLSYVDNPSVNTTIDAWYSNEKNKTTSIVVLTLESVFALAALVSWYYFSPYKKIEEDDK